MTSADSIMNFQMLYDALQSRPTTTQADIYIPTHILDDVQLMTSNKDAKDARTSFIRRIDAIVAFYNTPWPGRIDKRVCWSPVDVLAIHVILSNHCLMCDSRGE